DSQTNWIGRSEGAMVKFKVLSEKVPSPWERGFRGEVNAQADLPPAPSQGGGEDSIFEEDYSSPKYVTSDSEIYGILLERAKEMRKNPTLAERKLWDALRRRNLDFRFRRQHPIFEYIVDFVCLEKQLIIEVDGDIHKYQLDEDAERELLLEVKKGYHFLRFTNEEVLNDIENVLAQIE